MTSSIPNGFSTEDLERMLADAQPEPEVTTDPDNQSQERIIDIATEAIELACEQSEGPVVHKAILHMIVDKMLTWHTDTAKEMLEAGQVESAIGWARDAGKFQAIWNILATISVDPEDFTCEVK